MAKNDRILTLPRWAQVEIATLRGRVKTLEQRVADAGRPPCGSDHVGLSVLDASAMGDANCPPYRALSSDPRVRISDGVVTLDISIRDGVADVKGGDAQSIRGMAIVPYANNSVRVFPVTRLGRDW
jgi:hypothetical protein